MFSISFFNNFTVLHSLLNLKVKGAKTDFNDVNNTIQPTITDEGKLLSPFHSVLQYTNGVFKPEIKNEIKKMTLRNIFVQASSSRKLAKEHLVDWFTHV